MLNRTSYVQSIHVNSLAFSSTIQLGDSTYIQGFSRAMAVQREEELFFGNEGNFSSYPVYSEPIPFIPITENITLHTHNQLSSCIKVNDINILGVSSASLLHVGNSQAIQMEARIKHIRHLKNRNEVGKDQRND